MPGNKKVEQAIQIISTASHSIVLLNGIVLINSAAKHYTFQKDLDSLLLKGNNTLEIYLKPNPDFEIDESKLSLFISVFDEKHGVKGYSHYSTHDELNKEVLDESFMISPEQGEAIVNIEFSYNHSSQEQSLTSNKSDEAFNITDLQNGGLSRENSADGNYRFSRLDSIRLENGYNRITADFQLLEERDYTAIYTADEIPFHETDETRLYNELDASLFKSLHKEAQKAYDIFKQQDWDKWRQYIEPMVSRFQENPLFKGIYPPGMSANVEVDACINNMCCELADFPGTDEDGISASVLFQDKLAFIPGAIYYESTKFNYSKNIDIYYAFQNGDWIISYVNID